ncbi:hypothetical protein C8F04DRAFT_1202736 [Mycena alexandri]|uniref:Uncharacterized protein n=1 Tax=Mycena alexandri TaxID=1745969 RepID=A0AAD6RWJ8_9AGAR|nr:hypothetical protein C8F04DRAFT_1202736 [Mycena alexandri]
MHPVFYYWSKKCSENPDFIDLSRLESTSSDSAARSRVESSRTALGVDLRSRDSTFRVAATLLALIELVRRMSTPCNLRDAGARKIDPRVLARTHQGKAGFGQHLVWIPRQWYRAGKYQHGNRLVCAMEIVGNEDGDVARKERCRVVADRVNDGRNWGGYLFGEGVSKWSSLRKEAVVSTSNEVGRKRRTGSSDSKSQQDWLDNKAIPSLIRTGSSTSGFQVVADWLKHKAIPDHYTQ